MKISLYIYFRILLTKLFSQSRLCQINKNQFYYYLLVSTLKAYNALYSYYIVTCNVKRLKCFKHHSKCILVCRLGIYIHFYSKMTVRGTLEHPKWPKVSASAKTYQIDEKQKNGWDLILKFHLF
jgi:hypothetical protein